MKCFYQLLAWDYFILNWLFIFCFCYFFKLGYWYLINIFNITEIRKYVLCSKQITNRCTCCIPSVDNVRIT